MTSTQEARANLIGKWNEFNERIRDIHADFDQIYWIRTLSVAGITYLLYLTKTIKALDFVKENKGHLIHLLPFFALTLVGSIVVAYIFILHEQVTVECWCSENIDDSTGRNLSASCRTSNALLFGVYYFGTMIIYNYTKTTFSSPGVLNTVSSICTTNPNPSNNVDANDSWRSYRGQGGFCYIAFKQNSARETNTLQKYSMNGTEQSATEDFLPETGSVFIPNPSLSFCKKCQMRRPPRCHHCSHCNRCVLQMDHHCIWINNCIGYNNYRTFILTLVYLVVGCWFAIMMLFTPFYATIEHNIAEHGIKFLYKNKSGFLHLPMTMDLIRELRDTGTLEVDIVLKIVVPVIIFAGIFLTSFLYSHLCYSSRGFTTLEHMAKLNFLHQQALGTLRRPTETVVQEMIIINPFDQGVWQNILQILGPHPLLALLPMHVELLSPYLPHKTKSA